MTFRPKYTAEQRAAAVELVEELARVAGKRRGAIAAAAAQLGLHPSIVAHWTSDNAPAVEPNPARPRTSAPNGARRTGWRELAGLVWCELCGRPMVPTRTHLGAPAFGCPDRCRRRTGVLIAEVERVIGRMILDRLSVAGRAALNQMTVAAAVSQAPRLLNRIVLGTAPGAIRVQWRLAPLPVSAAAGCGDPRAAGNYPDRVNTPAAGRRPSRRSWARG